MFHNVLNIITIIEKVNPHRTQKRAAELEYLTKTSAHHPAPLNHANHVFCPPNAW
jgi:hypothetical protein